MGDLVLRKYLKKLIKEARAPIPMPAGLLTAIQTRDAFELRERQRLALCDALEAVQEENERLKEKIEKQREASYRDSEEIERLRKDTPTADQEIWRSEANRLREALEKLIRHVREETGHEPSVSLMYRTCDEAERALSGHEPAGERDDCLCSDGLCAGCNNTISFIKRLEDTIDMADEHTSMLMDEVSCLKAALVAMTSSHARCDCAGCKALTRSGKVT